MVILSQGKFPRILYIDGFAGPGEYQSGEPGSPIIALDAALGHRSPLTAVVHFLFVEERADRAQHLRQLVAQRPLPANFHVTIKSGITFEAAFKELYPTYLYNGRLIPTFAFIDPFGWTGAPFDLVKRILAQKNCEVFVNFMYEEINRFISHRDQIANFTSFFGTTDWNNCVGILDPALRNRCLHGLYLSQMQKRARFVRSFEMSNGRDVTDYYLFYATNEQLGLKKMKEAMWKVDESGEFRFSDATDPKQLVLFERAPNFPALRSQITSQFSGSTVTVKDVENFVVNETAFRETHYKAILKALETEGSLKANSRSTSRRAGTFGDSSMLLSFN